MFLPCMPCCGVGCAVADGKPRADPGSQGVWEPSGTWRTGVTWTFNASATSNVYYFYGSSTTSDPSGSATYAQITDWNNLCNWYVSKTTTPASQASLTAVLDKRARSLPPSDAIVHAFTDIDTSTGNAECAEIYIWARNLLAGSQITTTGNAFDSASCGSVFIRTSTRTSLNYGTVYGGAAFISGGNQSGGTVHGGGRFIRGTISAGAGNSGIVNGGCVFDGGGTGNNTIVNGDSTFTGDSSFNLSSRNYGTVNGNASFYNAGYNYSGTINGTASFHGVGINLGASRNISPSVVVGDAFFYGNSDNGSTCNSNSYFYDTSTNSAQVNLDAEFYNDSYNNTAGNVSGTATFNDNSCSRRLNTTLTPPEWWSGGTYVCNTTKGTYAGGQTICGCG